MCKTLYIPSSEIGLCMKVLEYTRVCNVYIPSSEIGLCMKVLKVLENLREKRREKAYMMSRVLLSQRRMKMMAVC